MTNWNPRANDLFLKAIELRSSHQRRQYLRAACAGDDALRADVESLLEASDRAGRFLESSPTGVTKTIDEHETNAIAGAFIGPYKLIEQIGEGGMGIVWMAQQIEPVKRVVAIKFIKAGMDSKQIIARFEVERQALALMDHANIARVLDAGTNEGRPYFVMDLVKGVPITTYCDEHHLTPRQRLELYIPVCHAVQHAHQKGIIHRDIKPSNVLVALYDGRPVPKVIDFGVAKAVGQALTERTMVTGFGNIVGTLEYMSPEQAEVNQLDIDTRSDIYSLGVLLYELLTGSPPFTRTELDKAGILEMLRVIREQEPSKPSVRLSTAEGLPTLAANRGTEPAKLTRLMRGELDWIVMKALEKDRNRRYETANGFAMDVQRYLADQPVQACPPSVRYRLQKFMRRNKGLIASTAVVLLTLLGGMIGTSYGLIRARQRAHGEQQAKLRAEANFELADEAVGKFLVAVTDVPQLKQPDFDPLRRKLLESALTFLQTIAHQQRDNPVHEADRGRAFLRLALLHMAMGDHDLALRNCEAGRDIFTRLDSRSPGVRSYRHGLANCLHNRAIVLARLDRGGEVEADFRRAVEIMEQLVEEDSDDPKARLDLAEGYNDLSSLLKNRLEHRAAARTGYLRSIQILDQLVAEFSNEPAYRHKLAKSHNNLGVLLELMGDHEAAGISYRQALDIVELLTAQHSTEPWYRLDLAKYQLNMGQVNDKLAQFARAESAYRRAVDILTTLAEDHPSVPWFRRDLANALEILGDLQARLGQNSKAEEVHRRALDVRAKLPAAFFSDQQSRMNLAQSGLGLGLVLMNQQKFLEAETVYRQARDTLTKNSDGPNEVLVRLQLNLGISLVYQQKLPDAESELRDALRIAHDLAAVNPDAPAAQRLLALSYDSLGNVLSDSNQIADANDAYLKAREIKEQLADRFPNVPDYAVDLGGTYCNYGSLVRDSGQAEASLIWFDKAIERLGPRLVSDPLMITAKQFLCNSHWGKAQSLSALDRHAEAQRDWQRALELDNGSARPLLRAGLIDSKLREARKVKDAAGCLAAAAEFESLGCSAPHELYNAACHRAICAAVVAEDPKTPAADAPQRTKEQADLAMAWLHKAVAAGFTNPEHMKNDTDLEALNGRDDFKTLVNELAAKLKNSGTGNQRN